MIIPVTAIKSLLDKSQRIVITSHQNPDGDAVGSALGWYHVLRNEKYKVSVILPDRFPDFLKWIPGSEHITFYDTDADQAQLLMEQADLVFCLDYNHINRTGELQGLLASCKAEKILIDHHPEPDSDFAVSYSDTTASSTAQMVVELTNALNFEGSINLDAALCLYSGILTDTGSFRFSSTSAKTHLIAAQLIDVGIDGSLVHSKIFDTNSEDRLKLTGFALSEKMTVLKNLKTAYFVLTKEELQRYNYKKGDTEGLVNYGLAIEGIEVSVIFMEHETDVRMSFRSFGNIPINNLAKKYFNGGGHKNAAGGRSTDSLTEILQLFNQVLPEFMRDYV